jgi:hypothetical protein
VAQLIRKYKWLLGLRINTLEEMEKLPGMADLIRIFHWEDVLYLRDEAGSIIPV